uniref:Amidophosphoribosyltransferase n=1 Tax=Romanomermis culicivorax TaxID=13658 RepID=A0A915KZ75_ROMCU
MCGIFGFILNEGTDDVNVASVIYLGLIALQHRGQEGAGMVTSDGLSDHFTAHRGRGLVADVFKKQDIVRLGENAQLGVGHTRYSTMGQKDRFDDVHPFVVRFEKGALALAHNGELVGAHAKREHLQKNGATFVTDVDTEILAHMILDSAKNPANFYDDWMDVIENTVRQIKTTSFSLLIMVKDRMFAVRDSWGNRPLCMAALKLESDTLGWVVASESTALNAIDADVTCYQATEIFPGEIVELTNNGPQRRRVVKNPYDRTAFCIFEYVYFARPSTVFEGQQVDTVRYNCGVLLAREAPVQGDIVSCVPESSFSAALGYASESGLPYLNTLAKNSYIGRSFILPNTKLRQQSIAKKFAPIISNIAGKSVILVDDSIVRGNTMQRLVKMLKDVGATKLHIRIASPAIRHTCNMGINIPTKEELIANNVRESDLAKFFGADSVAHLSIEGLKEAVSRHMEKNPTNTGHCMACFDGNYPVGFRKDLEW